MQYYQGLLPNYAEGLTSPETSEVVKAHLETCHTCRSLYEDYQKPVDIPQPEENQNGQKAYPENMVPVDVVSVLAVPLCGFPESRMGKTGPDYFRNFCGGGVYRPVHISCL